jgi:hypothetical protein
VLPLVRLPEQAMSAKLSLLAGWPSERIAYLCQRMPLKPGVGDVVELLSGGGLAIKLAGGQTITLGDEAQLDEKLDTLRTLLHEKTDLISQIKELNLTAPSRPVFIALKPELQQ